MQSARAREHIQHVHACVRACVLARITCMHACVHECIFMRARVYALRKSNVNNNNKVVTTSTHVHGTQTLALAFSHKKTNKSPFKDSIYTLSHEKGTNHFTTFRWWFVHSSEKKTFNLRGTHVCWSHGLSSRISKHCGTVTKIYRSRT